LQDAWPLLLLLLAAAIAIIIIQSWRLGLQRAIASAHQSASERERGRQTAAQARTARATDGERGAVTLLERAGYAVLEDQVAGSWTVRADGAPVTFGLRADYLVARDGRRYIAEVKTGRLAPRLSHGPTRRQLLEYSAAFDVHGVILVDADAETVTHVDLEPFARSRDDAPGAEGSRFGMPIVAVVAVTSFALGVIAGSAIAK
jgi:hypothetical protein